MKAQGVQFTYIGNHDVVNFINTEIVQRRRLIDLLQEDADLIRWAHAAGLNIKNRLDTTDLSTTLTLRRALKDAYLAKIDKLPAPRKALAILNQHLANHATHLVLQYNKQAHEYELVPAHATLTIPVFLAHLAYAGTKLLASPQAKQLKRCKNTCCVLIFLDTSGGQKRRWCRMETCGNRAKVATHYRNHLPQQ